MQSRCPKLGEVREREAVLRCERVSARAPQPAIAGYITVRPFNPAGQARRGAWCGGSWARSCRLRSSAG